MVIGQEVVSGCHTLVHRKLNFKTPCPLVEVDDE